eukprot:gnl/Spiro4/5709_TR2916_c0_g1_i1.p1 gnl/Spiro4/5709_TR2916_c0_g1~~gnl/Spiro4/5709_TR2916_c0_g1_i1.p1  ORF type:complete len:233 (-),score=54.14 gnl/Spiro4/5709_TR2916_c0_g1_i1:65-676(-)
MSSSFSLPNVTAIVMWSNLYRSALVFTNGLLFFSLITFADYTVISLACYTALFVLLFCVVWTKVMALLGRSTESLNIDVAKPLLPEGDAEAFCAFVVSVVNQGNRWFKEALTLRDVKTTGAVVMGLYLCGWFASFISGFGLLFLAFLFAFTFPRFYVGHKAQVDATCGQFLSLALEKAQLTLDKARGVFGRASNLTSDSKKTE